MRKREGERTLEVSSLGSCELVMMLTERRDTGGRARLGRKEIGPFCAVPGSHPGRDF